MSALRKTERPAVCETEGRSEERAEDQDTSVREAPAADKVATAGTCLRFTSDKGLLAKTYRKGEAGKLVKEVAANLFSGTYEVLTFGSVQAWADILRATTTRQALCPAVPKNGSVLGVVVSRRASRVGGALARTKEEVDYSGAPGIGFLDHDAPADAGGMAPGDLWQLLVSCAPGLAGAGAVLRPSGSSHICEGGRDLTGRRGLHLFILTKYAADWPRVVKVLAQRLWLAGHGRVVVGARGAMLLRCPIDTCTADPTRLIFAGGAECEPPLYQDRGEPVILNDGGWLDTVELVPDLDEGEFARYEGLVQRAKAAAQQESDRKKTLFKSEEVARRSPGMMRSGMSGDEAQDRLVSAVDALFGGVLLGDFELTAVHADGRKEAVTVSEVLADRDRWDGVDVLCPLNPGHRGESADARLYLNIASPCVYSLDDGGEVFRLRSQRDRLVFLKGNRSEFVAEVARCLSRLDCVFVTEAGPVLLDQGRLVALTPTRLQNLVGHTVALFAQKGKRQVPADISKEIATMVLDYFAEGGM